VECLYVWRSKIGLQSGEEREMRSLNISIELRLYFQATLIGAKASFNLHVEVK